MQLDPLQPVDPIEPQNTGVASAAMEAAPTWGVLDVLVGIGLILLLGGVIGLLAPALRSIRLPVRLPRTEISAALSGLIELLLLAPVWLVAIVWRRNSWATVGFRRFRPAIGCLLPVGYMCGALMVSAGWGMVVKYMQWPTQANVGDLFGKSPASLALGFFAVAVAAPIAEEAFFRGFLIGGLRRRLGAAGALIASAAIFTLPHLPISIYPAIFVLGLLLGLLFLQTKSLWPGILLHAAFNTLGFAAQAYCAFNSCQGL